MIIPAFAIAGTLFALCAFSPAFGVAKLEPARPDRKPSDGPDILGATGKAERAFPGSDVVRRLSRSVEAK